jgi:hypothetical protein
MVLRRRAYMDARWKRHDLARLIGLLVFNFIFAENGWKSTVMMLRGFRDGLRGISSAKVGTFPTKSGPPAVSTPVS